MDNERILVTGGAGFIGSQLTDRLLEANNDVTIVDDLSNGRAEWVPDGATLVERDLTDDDALKGVLTSDFDRVFHLAASKAVNTDSPRAQFEANTQMTYNVLETMQEVGVTDLAYTSTSTVYGEAPRPTPEDYAPLEPISVYGASKLADEGLCSTYAHSHDLTVHTFRFANIVGGRLRGAVIPDFIEKLQADPETLTILGDGRQEKSYMHVDDCIDAMLHVCEQAEGPLATYNLGTRTTTSVTRIADIVSEELGLEPEYEYTGGDRGWTGDVPKMRLSIEKLDALGWEPTHESDRAVREATRELCTEFGLRN
ncbi:UDP-glucose 4-epimerase [Natrinema pellirubrum DSM 15624]|uniref:Nucleoside-diphosphate-sugar epimerase n=1 Tax=Natrinema pellirubrum (strain DSM 15624 / CIP 106293 / JCM 10476 / NCIMB 786 / 157) TaxID=797303 RepID=L0JTE0_NATP1|nr:NAD-dependent epimerase/dehydratase family protein [Natrinema pellirubrum]AGB33882.1 nucleoside-diphosphate-sugar epimerase [Natrinema pellirubrum DSM 15624]ELY69371.1 UDP-glucose 4-epimerase [Natrinema pellirubrum DSM 15624]